MYGTANAYNAYKNNSINYASKEQLLLMLLDGGVKFSKIGRQAILDKDIPKAHEYLTRAQDIFAELMISLDTSAGSWAEQLFSVYDFVKDRLGYANFKKDINVMNEIIPIIEEIRDVWNEAYRISKGSK
ncbi:flagellar export chaperone FliS [Clostridium polynesiense]|uniref:flagellar export chaperone FliS n=1 Tax=Clostridium polynesiense TaxID=1325933 RepID=UPI00058B2BAF|nr:flagellar export chaperone FliS [Clostridium polynesiense]